jgi:hypothetical protein
MHLEYRFTFIDLFYLSATRLLRSLPFGAGVILVSFLFALVASSNSYWLYWTLAISGYCITLVVAALLLALMLSRKTSSSQLRSLRIEHHGLVETNGGSDTLLEWKNVRKMRAGIGVLVIYYGSRGRVLMVPAKAFRTGQEMKLFYHTVMQNSHAARV